MDEVKKIVDFHKMQMDSILESLQNTQQKGRPDCNLCEGSGVYYEPSGPDDVTPVPCDCNEKI